MQIQIEAPRSATAEDLPEISELLSTVFKKEKDWVRELPWQYIENPCGPARYVNARAGDGKLVGHYAVIPIPGLEHDKYKHYQTFLSLNTAVHPDAQGQGIFKTTAAALYDHLASFGPTMILGVANANSVKGFIGSLGFYDLGRMDLRFYLPWQSPNLDSDRLLAMDPAFLRWRSLRPGTRIVRDVNQGSLSRLIRHKGIPMEGLLTQWYEKQAIASLDAPDRSHLESPLRLYASSSSQGRGGIPVPERLRPSPLHYICKILPDEKAAGLINHLNSHRFEFLDFDVL